MSDTITINTVSNIMVDTAQQTLSTSYTLDDLYAQQARLQAKINNLNSELTAAQTALTNVQGFITQAVAGGLKTQAQLAAVKVT